MIAAIPVDKKKTGWALGCFLHISLQYLTLAVAVLHCSQKGKPSLINMSELVAAIWAPRHWLTHGLRPLAWTIQNKLQHVFRRRLQCHKGYVLFMQLKISVSVMDDSALCVAVQELTIVEKRSDKSKVHTVSIKVIPLEIWLLCIQFFTCRSACTAHLQVISI